MSFINLLFDTFRRDRGVGITPDGSIFQIPDAVIIEPITIRLLTIRSFAQLPFSRDTGDIALLLGAPAVGVLIVEFDYLVAFSAAGVTLIIGAAIYGLWDRWMVRTSAPFVAEEVLE